MTQLTSMKEGGKGVEIINEASSSQEASTSLDMVTSSAQDDIYSQGPANITRSSKILKHKPSSGDHSLREKDYATALKLFPEFLLQDTHQGNRSLSETTSRKTRLEDVNCLDQNDTKQNYLKTSEDIVQWIRTEYGI